MTPTIPQAGRGEHSAGVMPGPGLSVRAPGPPDPVAGPRDRLQRSPMTALMRPSSLRALIAPVIAVHYPHAESPQVRAGAPGPYCPSAVLRAVTSATDFGGTPMRIAVVALGKIGLPLAVQYAEKGHEVIGVDLSLIHI